MHLTSSQEVVEAHLKQMMIHQDLILGENYH